MIDDTAELTTSLWRLHSSSVTLHATFIHGNILMFTTILLNSRTENMIWI
jgi:hypothetical protein